MAMNLFDVLNSIFNKKEISKEEQEKVSSYMLALWLSHERSFIEEVNKANRLLFVVPPRVIYQYFFHSIPKGKKFIKWIKKTDTKEKVKYIQELQQEFDISKTEAKKFVSFRGGK